MPPKKSTTTNARGGGARKKMLRRKRKVTCRYSDDHTTGEPIDKPINKRRGKRGQAPPLARSRSQEGGKNSENSFKAEDELHGIAHHVAFVPIMDFASPPPASLTVPTTTAPSLPLLAQTKRQQKLAQTMLYQKQRLEILTRLKTEPTLRILFSGRNSGVQPELLEDDGSSASKFHLGIPMPKWKQVRYHEFYHSGDFFDEEVVVQDEDHQMDTIMDDDEAGVLREDKSSGSEMVQLHDQKHSNAITKAVPSLPSISMHQEAVDLSSQLAESTRLTRTNGMGTCQMGGCDIKPLLCTTMPSTEHQQSLRESDGNAHTPFLKPLQPGLSSTSPQVDKPVGIDREIGVNDNKMHPHYFENDLHLVSLDSKNSDVALAPVSHVEHDVRSANETTVAYGNTTCSSSSDSLLIPGQVDGKETDGNQLEHYKSVGSGLLRCLMLQSQGKTPAQNGFNLNFPAAKVLPKPHEPASSEAANDAKATLTEKSLKKQDVGEGMDTDGCPFVLGDAAAHTDVTTGAYVSQSDDRTEDEQRRSLSQRSCNHVTAAELAAKNETNHHVRIGKVDCYDNHFTKQFEEGEKTSDDVTLSAAIKSRGSLNDLKATSLPKERTRRVLKRKRIKQSALHVTRACTCLAMSACSRTTQSRYVALGDTAGYVTLYTTLPFLSPIARLETSASKRDYQEDVVIFMEKEGKLARTKEAKHRFSNEVDEIDVIEKGAPRRGVDENLLSTGTAESNDGQSSNLLSSALDDQLEADYWESNDVDNGNRKLSFNYEKKRTIEAKNKVLSLPTKSADRHLSLASQSANAIEAMCFTCHRKSLVVATKNEVELIDCFSGVLLWTVVTRLILASNSTGGGDIRMSRGPAIRLDTHPSLDDGGILGGYVFGNWKSEDERHVRAVQGQGGDIDYSGGNERSPLLMFQANITGDKIVCNVTGIIPKEPAVTKLEEESKEMKEATASILEWNEVVLGPRSVAMWDRSDSSRILAVYLNLNSMSSSSTRDNVEQQLVLLDSKTQHIINRVNLPMKVSATKVMTSESINQSLYGTYTLAATAARGGIRLFRTENLSLLATYGEGMSLHGHTVFWQECSFLKRNSMLNRTDSGFPEKLRLDGGIVDVSLDEESTQGRLIERVDEIRHRAECEERRHSDDGRSKTNESLDELLVMGVPHAFREPRDLNDTIHFWDLKSVSTEGSTLPTFTLKAPLKSDGIASLLYDDPSFASNNARLFICTQRGDCQELVPTLQSDFAGIMYSPGYQIVEDNLMYLEDEDELDYVVDIEESPVVHIGAAGSHQSHETHDDLLSDMAEDGFESDLATAILRSMMEDSGTNEDGITVDVVKTTADHSCCEQDKASPTNGADLTSFVPCLPEPYLQQKTLNSVIGSGEYNLKNEHNDSRNEGNLGSVLDFLPQVKDLEEELAVESTRARLCESRSFNSAQITSSRPVRPKRSKAGSLEAMIQACVDPVLRLAMMQAEAWSSGSGSKFCPIELALRDAETEGKRCASCLGRMVIHTCDQRTIPQDFERLACAEKEKEEKEAKEKMLFLREKKRAADARRRVAKRKERDEKIKRQERLGCANLQVEEVERQATEERELMRAAQEESKRAEMELAKLQEEERVRAAYWAKYETDQAELKQRKEEEEARMAMLELQNLRPYVSPIATPFSTQSQTEYSDSTQGKMHDTFYHKQHITQTAVVDSITSSNYDTDCSGSAANQNDYQQAWNTYSSKLLDTHATLMTYQTECPPHGYNACESDCHHVNLAFTQPEALRPTQSVKDLTYSAPWAQPPPLHDYSAQPQYSTPYDTTHQNCHQVASFSSSAIDLNQKYISAMQPAATTEWVQPPYEIESLIPPSTAGDHFCSVNTHHSSQHIQYNDRHC